jgi:hypothetical protein
VLRLLLFIVMLLAPDISDGASRHMPGIPTAQESPAAR